jgi:subfamily B ATP-binding cassette protein MsbA
MKDIARIYKIMLRYWGYLLAGLFFMLGYAVFSGVSIMMAIPLFDYVFKSDKTQIIYYNIDSFFNVIKLIFTNFINQHGNIFALTKEANYKPFFEELKSILSQTDPIFLLWIISITLIILILMKNFFFYGNVVFFSNLRGKSVVDIRNKMFYKYLTQSLSFFSKNKVGDSLIRMISDVNLVSNLFIGSIFKAIREIILVIIYAWIAFHLNAKLFLISLVLFPIFGLVINFLGKKIKKYARRIQEQSSSMFSTVEEVLNSMPIVKAFSREKYELNKFKKINRKHFVFWRKSILYSSFNVPMSELNGTITGVIILLIGGRLVLAPGSSFTLGVFFAFILAVFSMLHPIKVLTKTYTDLKKALVSLDRIFVILNREPEIKESAKSIRKNSFDDKIILENVFSRYDNKTKVLKNISFEINKGEKVALVGSSGSGKTTLVNLLPRMYDVVSGQITIDGISLQEINLKDLRTLFGTVTQESILFAETVANNISYGTLKEVSKKEIIEAAKIAYADEFIEILPDKYGEILSPKASNLSGGQKQRLCIARAIVGNPPILIFDEATSALDTEAERKVQQAIEQATKNRTVIVIAHRLSTILSSDKIVVLDKGKIVGMGKHQELLESCERYNTLYKIQFSDTHLEEIINEN